MRLQRSILSGAAALTLVASAAAADCQAELSLLTDGLAKDGMTAPLAGEAGATPQTGGDGTAAEPSEEGLVQDGTTAPLETDPGLATSAQDVEAQQQGGATAAEQAMGEAGGAEPSGRDAALARAEVALAAGDEAGCLAAVEEAKGM